MKLSSLLVLNATRIGVGGNEKFERMEYVLHYMKKNIIMISYLKNFEC